MAMEIDLSVIDKNVAAALSVSPVGKPIPMNAEQVRVIYDSPYPDYTGAYQVTPTITEQSLATMDTVLKNDIKINPIPYYETSNPSGGYTAIIGG